MLVSSKEAEKADFGKSVMAYFEKEFGSKIQARLQVQYRSNEKIMQWSSNIFYDGELKADDSVKDILISDIIKPTPNCYADPLVMIDTLNAGRSYYEVREQTSYKNFGEAAIVETQVRALIESGLKPSQIGIITPYKSQSNLIKKNMRKSLMKWIAIIVLFFSRHPRFGC